MDFLVTTYYPPTHAPGVRLANTVAEGAATYSAHSHDPRRARSLRLLWRPPLKPAIAHFGLFTADDA